MMEMLSIPMSGCNLLIDLLFPSASDFQFTDDTDLVAYAQFNIQHSTFNIQHLTFKKMSNRFTSRLSDDDDFKRDELIRKIEHSVEQMTLSELEALSYDMFTKGYMEDY